MVPERGVNPPAQLWTPQASVKLLTAVAALPGSAEKSEIPVETAIST
jgi:hypothetical protein